MSIFKQIVVCLIVIISLIIILVANPITFVSPGHKGVVIRFGKVQDRILDEGINIIMPVSDSVNQMSIRIQKYSVTADASSKDLQKIKSEIALNYHADPEKVAYIYKNIGLLTKVNENLIQPIVQEAVKASTALYTAEELITHRPEVSDSIKQYVCEHLNNFGIKIDNFSILHFDFSETYNAAIESKVTAEQQYLKAQTDLQRIKVEADQKIAHARAEAESLRMQKQEISADLIKLRQIEVERAAIEKWDGKLPETIVGGAMPFLNLTK